jgi:hypothetical protein
LAKARAWREGEVQQLDQLGGRQLQQAVGRGRRWHRLKGGVGKKRRAHAKVSELPEVLLVRFLVRLHDGRGQQPSQVLVATQGNPIAELNFFERGQEASRTSEIWEMIGLWLIVFLGLYQGALLLLHLVSVNVLGYTVLPLCVALLLLLGFRSTGREPLAITPEWARRWADPSRKVRAWTATYRFIVPALICTIAVTFLTMLVCR